MIIFMRVGTIFILEKSCGICEGRQVGKKTSLAYLRPDLAKEWDSMNKLNPKDVTLGSPKKVWWKCSICNYKWITRINHRTENKERGCPSCASSKGEKRIKKYLIKNNFLHIQERPFNDCKNKRPLPFDFYLPEQSICIEYQGEQHYKIFENEFYGGKKEFNALKKRDKIKKNYCKNNNIKLIIIPYWKFNDIEDILDKKLFKKR